MVTGNEVMVLLVLLVLGIAVMMVIVDCAVVAPLLLIEGSLMMVGVIDIVVLDITTTE